MRNVRSLVLGLAFVGLAGAAMPAGAQTITTLVDWTNSWRYDQTGRQLDPTWKTSAYTEDVFWQALSPGLLGHEPDTPGLYTIHAPINTDLTVGSTVTNYYFRTTFSYAGGATTGLNVVLTNLVDDGCIIYLNGVTVGQIRCSAFLNAASFADGTTFTEGQLDPVVLTNLSLLHAGVN